MRGIQTRIRAIDNALLLSLVLIIYLEFFMYHFFIKGALCLFASTAAVQSAPLEAIPDPAPPVLAPHTTSPATVSQEYSLEPQVTIRSNEEAVVEEYRMNGRLYKIVVTPRIGLPYILIDHSGDGSFVPIDPTGLGTPGIAVPMWVIGTF